MRFFPQRIHQILKTPRRLFSEKIFIHRDTPDNNASIPFLFTAENQQRADAIIRRYPSQYKKAAVIPLLHLGQKQLGWTSLPLMNEVARLLEIPPMRVYEVATFYTMFNREPVGKYFVQVCTTTPCELCGSDKVVEALKRELDVEIGGTTKDKLFTLVEVECAGACVNAPVIAINDDYYEDLTPESAIQLIKDIRNGKTLKAGPQNDRISCEPHGNTTSLTSDPPGPGFKVRPDL